MNDVSGSLTWSTPSNAFSPQNDVNFIFIRSASQPTTPSITNFPIIPTGWNDDVADVPSGANPIWVVKGITAFDTSGGSFRFRTTWQAANIIEGSNGADGAAGDDGADGDDGASNFTIFQESASQPSTPSAGTSNPPTSSWYSTLTAARNAVSGDGLVWFSVGTKPGTSSTITWSVPIRYVELYDHVGGTKPPEDANKFITIADSTEGRWRFSINDGSTTDVDVFSSGERTKLDRLRSGKLPTDATKTLEDTASSQTKATAAENAAKLQESTNRVTFPSNTTEGQFSFNIGSNNFTNDVFSSGERTKLNNLRAGTLPGGTGSLESTTGSQSKATAAETAAKLQESTNRVTFPTDNTEGRFTFNIGSNSFTNDVFSSSERTKLNNLRAGTLPGGTGSLESTTGSQSKATAAQTAAASDATSKADAAQTAAASDATSKADAAQAAAASDATSKADAAQTAAASDATSKANSAESNAKGQEEANRFTVPTNSTDGLFSFKVGTGGAIQSYDVLSSDSRTKFDRVRQGQDPLDSSKSIRNVGVTLSASGVLTGGGSSTQVNVGSIANSPFDTSGNVDTGETITVGSKITIDRNNERILIED